MRPTIVRDVLAPATPISPRSGDACHANSPSAPIAEEPATRTEPARVFDQDRAQRAVRELLLAIGEDPDREGLADTPRRVAAMYRELFAGVHVDPAEHLGRTFAESYDDVVVLRDIRFASTCEHHLLPFMGRAHVAYLPRDRVVGLSKLARTVHAFARRPQVQERMTAQIVDALIEHLDARGALVVVTAEHLCMRVRGVGEPESEMITTAARGALRDDRALRAEVLALLSRQ